MNVLILDFMKKSLHLSNLAVDKLNLPSSNHESLLQDIPNTEIRDDTETARV